MKSDSLGSANLDRCSRYATRSSVVCSVAGIARESSTPAASARNVNGDATLIIGTGPGGANTDASNIIVALAGALPGLAPRIVCPRGGRRCSPEKCDGDRFEYAKLDGKVIVSGPEPEPDPEFDPGPDAGGAGRIGRPVSTKGEPFMVSGGGMTDAKGEGRDWRGKCRGRASADAPYCAHIVSRDVGRNCRFPADVEEGAARLDPGRLVGLCSVSAPLEADARSFDL